MLEAKCAWLKHDWELVVSEAADFTGCVCKTREGIVSPLLWEPEGGGYFYMNTKLRNAMQNRWSQSLQTAAQLHMHSPFSRVTPPSSRRDQSSQTGLGCADIIVSAFATLSGSRESDATGAYC